MSWRPSEREGDDGQFGDLLRAALEHYGVRLRSRDAQMVACPLHEDRTPSCSVDLAKGVWNCHSCSQGGGAYRLIELKEGVNPERARAIAANISGTTGRAGSGGGAIRGSSYTGGGSVPRPTRNHGTGGGYRPSWRRG